MHKLPFSLSTSPDQLPPLQVNDEVYDSNQPLPDQAGRLVSEQVFHGYRIALIDLIPVEYIPSTGTLHYYSKVELTVNTVAASNFSTLRGNATDTEAMIAKVDNASMTSSYSSAIMGGSRGYDLLIHTATFHRVEGVWKLRGVRETLQAYLATPPRRTSDKR